MNSQFPRPQISDAMSLSRLINISDGVFAVAMTFLAFTVRLPAAAPDGSRPPAAQALAQMLPQLYTLAIAFVAAARFWIIHYRIVAALKRADPAVTVLNLFMLLFLVLLPITGDFVGVYPGEPIAVAIFAANMALIGAMNAAVWYVADLHHLMNEAVTPHEVRAGHWRGGLSSGVFVLSIPICWISTRAAKAMWLAVILLVLAHRKFESRHSTPEVV
jgi:uncharacterized membrane protein